MLNINKIAVKGDRVLVKQLHEKDKIGSFFIPESVTTRKEKRRADAWRAEIVNVGDKIDFESLKCRIKKGDILFCAPVSLDCPAFEGDDGHKYIIITQDDILAIEVKEGASK